MYSSSTRSSATSRSSGRSLSSVPAVCASPGRKPSVSAGRGRALGQRKPGEGRTERVLDLRGDALDAHQREGDERDDRDHQPALSAVGEAGMSVWARCGGSGKESAHHVVDQDERKREEVERDALLEVDLGGSEGLASAPSVDEGLVRAHLEDGREGCPNDLRRDTSGSAAGLRQGSARKGAAPAPSRPSGRSSSGRGDKSDGDQHRGEGGGGSEDGSHSPGRGSASR